MSYNIKLDDNKFFTGIYAKVGGVEGGVDLESLPPEENQLCYYWGDTTETVINKIPVIEKYVVDSNNIEDIITDDEYALMSDTEKLVVLTRNKLDENGVPVTTDKASTIQVTKWILSEAKLAESNNKNIEAAISGKKRELGTICSKTIFAGFDVVLSDGIAHHFSLESKDETSIMLLFQNATAGINTSQLFWHADGEICKLYSPQDIISIGNAAVAWRAYNETLINHLNRYIESLTSIESINMVIYSPSSLSGTYLDNFNSIIAAYSGGN